MGRKSDKLGRHAEQKPAHLNWWRRAIVMSGAGFLFSALSSVLIVTLLALGFPPAVALERAGADLSMRLYSNFHDFSLDAAEKPSFVLLDLDKGACATLLGASNPECALGRPAPIELVWKAAAAASDAGASVILVDVDMESGPNGRQSFLANIGAHPRAWIVLPFKSRASDEAGRINVDRSALPENERLHSAAFATIVTGADGVVRQYPRALQLGGAEGAWVPTAPWVAVQLSDLSEEKKKELSRQSDGDIFYSLPRVENGASAVSDSYRQILEYMPVSAQITGATISFPEGRLNGKIVVIGSSNGASQDLHSTPVGTRSGSEILVNAVRTLTAFKPLTPLSRESSSAVLFDVILEKIASAVLPTGIILLFLLAREQLYDLKKFAGWRAGVWIATTAAVIIFSIVFELTMGLASVGTAAREGHCIDLVTPFVTLGLDFYRETAGAIVKLLEELVTWIMERGENLWRRLAAITERGVGKAFHVPPPPSENAKRPAKQARSKAASAGAAAPKVPERSGAKLTGTRGSARKPSDQ